MSCASSGHITKLKQSIFAPFDIYGGNAFERARHGGLAGGQTGREAVRIIGRKAGRYTVTITGRKAYMNADWKADRNGRQARRQEGKIG